MELLDYTQYFISIHNIFIPPYSIFVYVLCLCFLSLYMLLVLYACDCVYVNLGLCCICSVQCAVKSLLVNSIWTLTYSDGTPITYNTLPANSESTRDINEPQLPRLRTAFKAWMYNHPMRRTRFGQYQVSSAALG